MPSLRQTFLIAVAHMPCKEKGGNGEAHVDFQTWAQTLWTVFMACMKTRIEGTWPHQLTRCGVEGHGKVDFQEFAVEDDG